VSLQPRGLPSGENLRVDKDEKNTVDCRAYASSFSSALLFVIGQSKVSSLILAAIAIRLIREGILVFFRPG